MSNKVSEKNYVESAINGRAPNAQPPVFFLCEGCRWCATFLDKSRFPLPNDCPICFSDLISSFPILPTEAFTFDYNDKRGIELDFRRRK